MQHFIYVSHIVGRVMGWWRWLCDVFLCSFLVWAYILALLLFYMLTTHWSLNCMGIYFGTFAILYAHHSLKLELYGHIFWCFCYFICPLLIEAWIVWAYILVLLLFYMPTAHWSLNCVGIYFGTFVILYARHSLKLELYGHIFGYFCYFICPPLN